MNIAQIEGNIQELSQRLASGGIESHNFIYKLLLAYGHRKQSVTRLRSGERNMASKSNDPNHGEVIWKRHLYYKHVDGIALYEEIDRIRKEKFVISNKIRFVIVTNFDQLLAVDTKTSDTLDISLADLPKQFDFFLPWAGMEKAVYQGENPADVKAAEKMAKLFDLIKGDNFDESNKDNAEALHGVNVFLTRLLFCFFAEDTEIFTENQFSLAIKSHTNGDGSDLSNYLNRLFTILNTADCDRPKLPDYLASFPYVNGGLFAKDIPSPKFSAKSRQMLVECGGDLDWSDINPDIFGSMIQAVVHPDQRGDMGMHYTSIINIMKVIEPLFLNDLYEELDKVEGSKTKLQKLQQRLGEIKIFDPACGSGNFLIIAYKELRKLEMEVLKRIQEINDEKPNSSEGVMVQIFQPFSIIELSQFYGIELDDFAHEVAILSLWLTEHQMNVEFKAEFGEMLPSLPLKNGGNIKPGNAIRTDWNRVCADNNEVYILGNPPYLGSSMQSSDQKEDLERLCSEFKNYKNLDYIACWFIKASQYISTRKRSKYSFVSTNSICQGEQVALLWPYVFSLNLEICFGYQAFKWSNNAKANAAVMCVIVGVGTVSGTAKKIFTGGNVWDVNNINPYLTEGNNIALPRRSKPISDIAPMVYGNKSTDNGLLFLDSIERDELLREYPASRKFIKKLVGSVEFIRGVKRWCLWIDDQDVNEAIHIPEINTRLEKIKEWRLKSKAKCTVKYAEMPHKFKQITYRVTPSIVIPRVSSERRKYIPFGFQDKDTVILDSAQAIYTPDAYIFGVITSLMHNIWVKATSGRLESRIRYSSALSYNNFPVRSPTQIQREAVTSAAMDILTIREKYPDQNMSELYDPNKMPLDLLEAHARLDSTVENMYQAKPFQSDIERLSVLFKLYEKMTGGQNA